MRILIAILCYVFAMTAANLLVAKYGPGVTPVLGFVLVGLDLALRNWLQVRMRVWQMALLIAFTSVVTYVLNPAADQIAIASALAFATAASAEWATFSVLNGTWTRRSLIAGVVGAAVDSLVFPTVAFGMLLPLIVAGQFAAKTAGGAFWTYVLRTGMPSRLVPAETRE